jgi:hypothetical protein
MKALAALVLIGLIGGLGGLIVGSLLHLVAPPPQPAESMDDELNRWLAYGEKP